MRPLSVTARALLVFLALVVGVWGLQPPASASTRYGAQAGPADPAHDFDGDDKADMGLWRPSDGTWYVRTSTTGFDGFLVRQ